MEQFYTEPFLHTNLYAQKHLHTNIFYRRLLQADTFAHKCLDTQIFLPAYSSAHMGLSRQKVWFLIFKTEFLSTSTFSAQTMLHTHTVSHTDIFCWFSFAHRNIDTQRCFQRSCDTQTFFLYTRFFATFSTQTLLDPEHFPPHKQHTNNLTPKPFHTEGFTKNAFAHTFFCQQTNLLHRKTVSLLDAFLWRTEIYTHRSFHTQTRSHKDTCAYWRFDTQRAFYTKRRSEGPQESLVYGVIRFNN
jgi:hypothetical protein